MNEREGCRILKEAFEAAGLSIREHHPFALDAGRVSLDGWDEARKVGYELVTTEAGDRVEFTPAVIEELEARMERGELHVLLIDELEIAEEPMLRRAATRFLEALRARGVLA